LKIPAQEYPSAAAHMMAAIVPAPPLERSLADSTDVAAAAAGDLTRRQEEDNMDSSHVQYTLLQQGGMVMEKF
jgi:hypothetical protein